MHYHSSYNIYLTDKRQHLTICVMLEQTILYISSHCTQWFGLVLLQCEPDFYITSGRVEQELATAATWDVLCVHLLDEGEVNIWSCVCYIDRLFDIAL